MKPAVTARRIEAAVERCVGNARVVLAVSGGRDSMALLHAGARVLNKPDTLVATFDHATGIAATRAAHHVAGEAARLGFTVVVGRAAGNPGTEAGWRDARHAFLSEAASAFGGRVATAHTRDDQVETVLIRVLRDAGARGLAGLYAPGPVLRPLLEFSRDEVAAYAAAAGATWIDDPTNASTRFLRNRVRRDLLPALHRADPDIDFALLGAARRAAELRSGVEGAVRGLARREGDRITIDLSIARNDRDALSMLWPAIVAWAGVAMDRRGTERVAAFTRSGKVGSRVPLTGRWIVTRARDGFELHRDAGLVEETVLVPGLELAGWRFDTMEAVLDESDRWAALLPPDRLLRVRSWRAGDRMRSAGLVRRVKRYLSDAGVTGEQRARWPVVLAGDEIVWIPGVRRSDAAAVRPGRPGLLYRCGRDYR